MSIASLGRRQPPFPAHPGGDLRAPTEPLTRPGKRLQEHPSPKLHLLCESVSLGFPLEIRCPRTDLPGELRGWGSYPRPLLRCSEPWAPRGLGAVGLRQAQSHCRLHASFSLSPAVSVWTRGIRHVSKWIFLKKCANVDVVQDVPPHPSCHCPSGVSFSVGFIPHFFSGKFCPPPPASCRAVPLPPSLPGPELPVVLTKDKQIIFGKPVDSLYHP